MTYIYYLVLLPIIIFIVKQIQVKKVITNFMVEQMLSATELSENSLTINPGRNSATITFDYLGQPRQITVPYNRKITAVMNQYEVIIIRGDKFINITNMPGIKYTCCGNDLRADRVIIKNKMTGEEIDWPLDTVIELPSE